MDKVIECEGLTFRYNSLYALNGLSFSVKPGEVFALLGPNGAGKTTTIRVLNGLLRPEKGKSHVLGLDPTHAGALIRKRTGVLTETPALYERLTAWQNLDFFGALAGMSSAEIRKRGGEYLEMFELQEREDDRVETYSKGMKQRLALARALLHNPEMLFLDEPTSGMDPAAAKNTEGLIYQISKRENRTVILCTHRLYEAEKVCDRVAVMKQGAVIASGSLDELRRDFAPEIEVQFCLSVPLKEEAVHSTKKLKGVIDITIEHPAEWLVKVDSESVIPSIVSGLVGWGAQIKSVIPHWATLVEIYLYLQQMDGKAEK